MLKKKKKRVLVAVGIACMVGGAAVLAVFDYRRISRKLEKLWLLKTCVVLEIPDLSIEAPILEGTDNEVLSKAAGHFPDTGALGDGNYSLAGHNSTIYAEIFNDLDQVKLGMEITLTDTDEAHTVYTYQVTDYFIVDPEETWMLEDFGDDRITLITCTDDGTQQQVIVWTYQGGGM